MKLFITLSKSQLAAVLAALLIGLIIFGQLSNAESGRIDGSTNAMRMQYLKSLKLDPDDSAVGSKDIIIPSEFDSVYSKYNVLQKQAGFDLTRYKGEEATVYTYPFSADSEWQIHLIVCKGEVIGGDVSSVRLDGEMKPLK